MKVSVVIPLYNAELFIGRCLDSILNQTYKDIEIIVVDDVSQDGSLSIVEDYQQSYPSIKIIKHSTNKGSMMSRKDGYMAATGECLMFVDSDDALPIYAVEKLVRKQVETGADIVSGNAAKIYVDGHKERLVDQIKENAGKLDFLKALLNEKARRCLWGRLYRTSLFHDHELKNLDHMTIYEDACLLYQVAVNAERIESIVHFVYDYYENKASVTQRVYGKKQIESIIMANSIIYEVCRPFTQISYDLQHRLARTFLALYSESISAKEVKALLRKHGMLKYGEICSAYKYLKLSDFWYCLKRFVYVRTKLNK